MRTRQHTSGDPTDRLSTEERHKASQLRLAREVNAACTAWLRSRGIGPGRLFTYDGPDKARQHPKDARISGTGGDTTRGEGQKSDAFDSNTDSYPFFTRTEI